MNENDYLEQTAVMKSLLDRGAPYLVNIYADPSQIYDWDDFFTAMGTMARYNVASYGELLELFSSRQRT